ncbi:MAG TPA: glycosyltransferase family 4 protein [Candidatus Acidoferrum sp.]|nr:glycosyltransferase family 4 protein [Candidatus Acidoferrum sp.]
MKIGLISAYDYAHPGGVTEHVRHLARGLRRRGHDVSVLAPCSDRDFRETEFEFIRIGRPFPIPMHGSVARITVSLQLTNRIKHYVRDSGFDVIHCHEPLMPVLPLTALRYSRTVNIGTFHAFARSNVGYYYGKPLLKRYVRKLHIRIAVSNPAREFVEHYFPGDYRVIPNGIDVHRFENQSPYGELRDGMCNLLFVGRLEYRKGLGYLLRAYAQLKPQYPNLRLIIVGDGPLRRWYANFIYRKQLDDVVMAGYVPAAELPRYYASADVFCSPATGDESFGIVLLEAMASGKPIVATSIDGFREVVTHGREGLLVERKSRRQLAYALQTLIGNPALRQEMGQAGLLKAQQYDWERVIDQLTAVYRQAIDIAQPAPSMRLEPSLSPR